MIRPGVAGLPRGDGGVQGGAEPGGVEAVPGAGTQRPRHHPGHTQGHPRQGLLRRHGPGHQVIVNILQFYVANNECQLPGGKDFFQSYKLILFEGGKQKSFLRRSKFKIEPKIRNSISATM